MTLRERRLAKGYPTVSALAKALDVPLVSLYKWENAVCLPNYERLQNYASALDCATDDIINDFREMKGGNRNGEEEVNPNPEA